MQTNMLSSDLTGSWDYAISFMKVTTVNELKFDICHIFNLPVLRVASLIIFSN